MKTCPKCGCLNDPNNNVCSMCNSQLEVKEEKIIIEKKEEEVKQDQTIGKFFNQTFMENANLVEDDNNIVKQEYVEPKKDNSTTKAAILAIIVVITIVTSVFLGIYFGWFNPRNSDNKILNEVINQANNYEKVVLNYLKKYDYKTKKENKNTYHAKNQDYEFLEYNISNECQYLDSKYNNELCEHLFNDINNNYCRATKCDIPSSYRIKIVYKQETISDEENNEIINKIYIIDDNSTLTYEDIECNKINGKYTCKYKK